MSEDSSAADTSETPCWHGLEPERAVSELDGDAERGLDPDEIGPRRERHGDNRLTPQRRRTALVRLASQFNNLFIYLLIVAGVITGALGEWVDSGVIFGVVLIIALIGFIQEGRAEKALEAVRQMLTPRARVVRDGRARTVAAEELVPGDIILLEAGDGVPADARVLKSKNLQAQEAALTGESTAVEKQVDPVDQDAELGDRLSMVYSGTLITSGHGRALVSATGDDTEIGRISRMLAGVETLRTPLMRRLDAFTRVVSFAILGLAAFTFLVGTFAWDRDWAEMFFAAVSIAVAAIPEGLPAVMTVTLAIGVQRMARRNAIIRRLPAVETLGSVTVICTDKTGTLTRNEMTVRSVCLADRDLQAEGVGYQPEGELSEDGQAIDPSEDSALVTMIRAGVLCNDSELHHDDGDWKPEGDPTEAALLVLARKAGIDPDEVRKNWKRLDLVPFSSERRYMATHDRSPDGDHYLFVKGAPERLLEMCDRELCGDDSRNIDRDAWHRRADAIAERGQRVLAVATRRLEGEIEHLDEDEVESGLVLIGLFGFIDPPRAAAIESVRVCREAGIRVKMITGDHALTAGAIASELSLENTETVMTGREVGELSEDELRSKAWDCDVFARASPEHKLHLVEALQARGAITAMTGDGVNDAPALKRADIGIAMGEKGTDAAREASEMVLADDNFVSIQRAIEEGRTVYDNLKKAILFILPTNLAQSLVIIAAILAGTVLPVIPVQILWVNMITAVTLGIAFAWERAEGDIMRRPPRAADEPLLTGFMIWRVGLVGILLTAGVGVLFMREIGQTGTSLEYARTIAVNTLVMGQIAYLLNARYFDAASWNLAELRHNPMVLWAIGTCVGLQLLFTHAPFMNRLFSTESLGLAGWSLCIGFGVLVFVLIELEKAVFRHLAGRRRGNALPPA